MAWCQYVALIDVFKTSMVALMTRKSTKYNETEIMSK